VGYQLAAQPPTWRTRGCSSSGLYLSTNPAWLDLPGTKVPAGTALWVIETHNLHHHNKVANGVLISNLGEDGGHLFKGVA